MNIAIVGAGKLGFTVADVLSDGDYSVTVIDTNAERLDRMSDQMDVLTVNEDARKISVLKDLEIDHFQYLLALTSNDETNLFIASAAKHLGCERVIARVRNPEHMNDYGFIQKTFGIDMIVNPDYALTNEIYKYLAEEFHATEGIISFAYVSISAFHADNLPDVTGRTLVRIRADHPHFLVLAISRGGRIIIPHGDTIVRSGDTLFLLGEKEDLRKLVRRIREHGTKRPARDIMIIGGGTTGYYLAKRLSDYGASVKVAEIDEKRCRYLAANLKNVMVLHSDGTDTRLLQDENIEDMDAFISATGYDEGNLLMALRAKEAGVTDVIAKVSHSTFKELIEKTGVDMVLNPLEIAASVICRYIAGEKNVFGSTILQGQAELLAVQITEKTWLTSHEIKNLDLPDSILIAAIWRDGRLIVPDGNTTMQVGDNVVFIYLLSEAGNVEYLLRK